MKQRDQYYFMTLILFLSSTELSYFCFEISNMKIDFFEKNVVTTHIQSPMITNLHPLLKDSGPKRHHAICQNWPARPVS